MPNNPALDAAFWTYCKATGLNPDSHPAVEEAVRQAIEAYEAVKVKDQPDENTLRSVMQALCGVFDVQPFRSIPLPVIIEAAKAAIAAMPERESVALAELIDWLEERVDFPTILSEQLLERFEIRRKP